MLYTPHVTMQLLTKLYYYAESNSKDLFIYVLGEGFEKFKEMIILDYLNSSTCEHVRTVHQK